MGRKQNKIMCKGNATTDRYKKTVRLNQCEALGSFKIQKGEIKGRWREIRNDNIAYEELGNAKCKCFMLMSNGFECPEMGSSCSCGFIHSIAFYLSNPCTTGNRRNMIASRLGRWFLFLFILIITSIWYASWQRKIEPFFRKIDSFFRISRCRIE